VAAEEYDNLPAGVKDHEPRTALFGGESGLDVYRRLIPGVSSRLVEGGCLLLELGAGQAEQVTQLVERGMLSLEKVVNDLQGIPRCLVARKPLRRKDG
jgi:release factor glutamine methyltransferase